MSYGDNGLGIGSNTGCIGEGLLHNIGNELEVIIEAQGILFSFARYESDTPSDIYREPDAPPVDYEVRLLLVKQESKVMETLAGAKIYEVITLTGAPASLKENDIITHGAYKYDVRTANKAYLNGAVVAETYEAMREVLV